MSQKKQWDPEVNTVAEGGGKVRDLTEVKCCVPVSMSWAVLREGGLVLVGLRHMGFTCAGRFQEMPYRRWQRARFLPEKKVRRK